MIKHLPDRTQFDAELERDRVARACEAMRTRVPRVSLPARLTSIETLDPTFWKELDRARNAASAALVMRVSEARQQWKKWRRHIRWARFVRRLRRLV